MPHYARTYTNTLFKQGVRALIQKVKRTVFSFIYMTFYDFILKLMNHDILYMLTLLIDVYNILHR